MQFWRVLLVEASYQSHMVELPPEANIAMSPSLVSTAWFMVGTLDSENAYGDFVDLVWGICQLEGLPMVKLLQVVSWPQLLLLASQLG